MMKLSVSPFTNNNIPVVRIHPSLLTELSKAGRNLIAYIINEQKFEGEKVYLSKVAVVNYYSTNIGKAYANTVNVNRGIKELISNHIIAPSTEEDVYFINTSLITK